MTVFGLALALAAGYGLRSLQQGRDLTLALQHIPPVEYYVSRESFSEVEQTKANLDALSCRFLTDWRVRNHPAVLAMSAATQAGRSVDSARSAGAIQELEQAIEEFKATEEELVLAQELLRMLKHERLYDRWLDLYLRALYEHPTDHMVGSGAQEAVAISQATGRQAEVRQALEHVTRIPFEFPAKARAAAALRMAKLTPETSH
jgi:hypothetical protein